MTSAAAAACGRMERDFVVGAWRVDVATAAPTPGESLSAAARRLAERIIADRVGLPLVSVRVASLLPSGRPVVSAEAGMLPLSVSVAHERGLVGAAVCDGAGVGIDIVDVSVDRAGLDHWLDEAERAVAAPGMIWAAKEAAFKSAGLDTTFRPLRVSIEPIGVVAFSWTLRDAWRTVCGAGRFLDAGRHLVAVACADPSAGAAAERSEWRGAARCS